MDQPRSREDAEAIKIELDRILASEVFSNAQRSQAFLRYVVEKSILGQVVKEYEVAVDVLGRSSAYDPAVDSTVRVEAGRLRNRLREYYSALGSQDPLVIEVPKGGYSAVFTHRNGKLPTLVIPPAENPPSSASGSPQLGRRRTILWFACFAALAIAVALSVGLVMRRMRAPVRIRSLAVLPLQNLSGDPGEDYFAAGMTDELTTELAHIQGLRVVSRTSALLAGQAQKSLPQIADALNVEAVVEGSVLRSGNRIRITAQLIDAKSDKHLWAQSFEGQANDILSLQDTVAHQIAMQTQVALTAGDLSRLSAVRSVRPEAHDDYLRGLYFIQRRDPERAAQYFHSAIGLEPAYAQAWAGLAQALMTESTGGTTPADQIMPRAIQAAKRATELDPDSGEAYIALGAIEFSYARDWDQAERDLRRGIALSPGDPLGQVYLSIYLTDLNRPDEAVVAARRALDLDPLGFFTNRNLGQALYYDRHYDESLAALRRAAEIAPDRLAFVEGWNSAIAEVQGHYSDAVDAELRGLAPLVSSDEADALHGAFAAAGWKGYQKALIRYMLPRSATNCFSGYLAISYLRLGEIPDAFQWFQREADQHCVFASHLAADPRLDPVRHDPHYLAYQDRLRLPH